MIVNSHSIFLILSIFGVIIDIFESVHLIVGFLDLINDGGSYLFMGY